MTSGSRTEITQNVNQVVEQITKADLLAVTLFNEVHNVKTKKRASQLYGGLVPPLYLLIFNIHAHI